MAVVFTLS